MRNRKLYFNIHALLFLINLGIAIALSKFAHYTPQINLDDKYIEEVKESVQKELQIMDKELEEVKMAFYSHKILPFVEINKHIKHPFFIFQNNQLVFWSDYRFVPDYYAINGEYKVKLFNLKNSKYLVKHLAFDSKQDKIEIFSFLNIYKKYKLDNSYLKSGYNEGIIPHPAIKVSANQLTTRTHRNIYAKDGDFLFSLESSEQYTVKDKNFLILALIASILGGIFLGVYCRKWVIYLKRNRKYEIAFLILGTYLISLRALMLYFNIPFAVLEWNLFDPKYYASSAISPSIGDLLLNILVITILMVDLMKGYYRSHAYRNAIKANKYIKYSICVVVVALTYILLYSHFYILSTIYLHSQLTLDISISLEFPLFKIICLFIFALISCIYFVGVHIASRIFIRLSKGYLHAFIFFFLGSLLYIIGAYLVNHAYRNSESFIPIVILPIVLINGLYFIIVYYWQLPKFLYRFRYLTSIYLFLGALVCAVTGVYSIYSFGEKKTNIEKQKFATQLLADNDILTEVFLHEASEEIAKDEFIRSYLLNPLYAKNIVEQKITRYYLNEHFDRYQLQLSLFDAQGNSLTPEVNKENFFSIAPKYQNSRYATSYKDIYFINDAQADDNPLNINMVKQYMSFTKIARGNITLGYVMIDLKQKKIILRDVYPELLIDKKFTQSIETRTYSYAIYHGKHLVYSFGTYNYDKDFKLNFLQQDDLYTAGIVHRGNKHLAVKGGNQKTVVVSSVNYPTKHIFANFSFLFLVLVVAAVCFVVVYILVYSYKKVKINFATKIQFYLNLAFFLPLFIVSITTLSVISASYERDLTISFIHKAETVGNNIVNALENYRAGKITKDALTSELLPLARYSEVDVNVFNTNGRLITSSQPAIYDKNTILSRYINPEALASILEVKDKYIMLSESVGTLNYKSAYVAVRSYENGTLLGILSIPFFESKYELDRKIMEVLSTTLNIFTAIFIVFVLLSYFASHILTIPLRLITQKITKTTLHDTEPLVWDSDDEIGLLVGEYNKMLMKLEDSKDALAQTEKETAWREMAKQVAHEIKNPLTPMKLTLQHLQMQIANTETALKGILERSLGTLLSQVNTLSDIASSFSAFAKMPIPKSEDFDVAVVLQKTINLYKTNQEIILITHIEKGTFFVKGDEQLISRIFTNLIINAIQAVPEDRKPEILISLASIREDFVTIEVKDNGAGIPEKIRNRIFVPNFSTKSSGSGIGLAMAKRGIEHVGGKIWFETQEGIGTVFFIDLPLVS